MSYPGGKSGSGVYQRIINAMPPHDRYVEPFLGGGAIARLKRPALVNVGIEKNADVLSRTKGEIRTAHPRAKWLFLKGDGIKYMTANVETKYPDYKTLVYCDPPYLKGTRTKKDIYRYEMSAEDHRRFLRVVMGLKCMVMVSGYWSEMYSEALARWNYFSFQAMTRGGLRTEVVWHNFAPAVELHDYGYLGDGFRERERIKRKKARWVAKLEKMPLLERRALLAAIRETA